MIVRPAGRTRADGRAAEMAGDRLGRILAALSGGEDAWTSARLRGACPGLAGVTGAGIMLMSGEVHRGTLSASDEVSRLMEELQYTLGEGPCVDAFRQDRVVAEPDLAGPARRHGGGWRSARRRCRRGHARCSGSRCRSAGSASAR